MGVAMVAPVEVGEGGIDLLVSNGLLDQGKKNDRQAVGKACLDALSTCFDVHPARKHMCSTSGGDIVIHTVEEYLPMTPK